MISAGLRWLDFLPARWAWAAGLGFGALAGAALTGVVPVVPRVVGVAGFLALFGMAAALVWSSEPIAIDESPPLQIPELAYNSQRIELVSIPGGTFQMGSPESEEGRADHEGPVHKVDVSSFACMRYPVTHHLYAEITGADSGLPKGDADDRPVTDVSWYEAVTFCNQLSEREGLTPCYRIIGNWVAWKGAANGYRLLTEAEWEYACRAGSTTRWSFGDDESALGNYCWFGENAERPGPMGSKKPNPWGLHDMHGNVWEWCWDWFGSYAKAAGTDPNGPLKGAFRVLRGGAFFNAPRLLRSAFRGWKRPGGRSRVIGFRCARGASPLA